MRDTGARTTGRGRVGSYYALAPTSGPPWSSASRRKASWPRSSTCAAPSSAGACDRCRTPRRAGPRAARPRAAVAEACARSTVPSVLAVVSAADPVDRQSGRLVHLPDSPFLVGALDPVSVLGQHVTGPVIVDNDVNWAARAESAAAAPGSSTTSPTSTSARASDAPSSATARFAAATTG